MQTLAMVSAVLRVLLVFVLVLLAIRKDLSLGNALFLGALVLGAVFGLSPVAILQSIAGSLLDPKPLALTVMVCLIQVFSHGMEAAGASACADHHLPGAHERSDALSAFALLPDQRDQGAGTHFLTAGRHLLGPEKEPAVGGTKMAVVPFNRLLWAPCAVLLVTACGFFFVVYG